MKLFKSPMFLITVLVILMIVVGYQLKKKTEEIQAGNVLKAVKVEFPERAYDLYGVTFVAPTTFIAVGSNGMIVRSEDSGRTWREQGLDLPGENLLSVAFSDESHGWIVGTNALVYRTSDGGKTWKRGYLGPSQTCSVNAKCGGILLRRVYFLDERVGWIVGEGPTLLYTGDSGKNWELKDVGKSFVNLNDIGFFNKEEGLVVGESGTICYTGDGGATWHGIDGVTNETVIRLHVIDGRRALAVGLGGLLIYTGDKGKTWRKMSVSDEAGVLENHLFGLAWLPALGGPNDVIYVTGDGLLGRSFDFGRSWRFTKLLNNDETGVQYRLFSGLCFIDNCNGIAVGKHGVIALTKDAQSWERVN